MVEVGLVPVEVTVVVISIVAVVRVAEVVGSVEESVDVVAGRSGWHFPSLQMAMCLLRTLEDENV